MTKINVIVAICKNRGIGYNNNIPWGYIKKDMQNFRKLTIGNGNNAIIMGKNTFFSLPKGPLLRRDNYVLSSSMTYNEIKDIKNNYIGSNLEFFKNKDELDKYIKEKEYDEIWIIGGEQIYKLYINSEYINEIHLTYIDNEYKCDRFFPNINSISFISKTLSYSYEYIDNDETKYINVYNINYKS